MGVSRMTILVAHLRTLKTWLIFGGWPRFFLLFSSIPIMWLFWGFACPSIVSSELNLINIFLALFAVWYSLSYLQDFTRSDSSWGISGSFYLPTCPALPIGPFMRMAAEFIFFFILLLILFIPFFFMYPLLTWLPAYPESKSIDFLFNSIQGTLAIAPLVFCMRIIVHGTFILPVIIRMALPILLCCAFILFHIFGFFSTLSYSFSLFAAQVFLLYVIFFWFRNPIRRVASQPKSTDFPRHVIDDMVITTVLGKTHQRKVRSPETQIALDLSKIIFLYMAHWFCIYLPLIGSLYYAFLHLLEIPMMHLFFFFLLLILPAQDIRALKERFILPTISLPVRQDVVMRRLYLLFSLCVALIWTTAIALMALSDGANRLALLPLTLLFAPTMAGVWVNRITNRQMLMLIGIALLCTLPLGFILGYPQQHPIPFISAAFVGSLLPVKILLPPTPIPSARR